RLGSKRSVRKSAERASTSWRLMQHEETRMNLANLLEVSSDLSARGDLTGWFQLARSYLLAQQDTHIVEWTNQHLGWQGTPAGSAPRLHHLGLTFFSNSSDLSIADLKSHATKCGFSEPR